jgi:hypothetical protein
MDVPKTVNGMQSLAGTSTSFSAFKVQHPTENPTSNQEAARHMTSDMEKINWTRSAVRDLISN